jgi:hypothetical protein
LDAVSSDLRELVQTNDAIVLSAIEALLAEAHISYLVSDGNVSALAGAINAFPRRILVRDCCLTDARRLLADAGMGDELPPDESLGAYQAARMSTETRKSAVWLIIILLMVVLWTLF